MTRAETARRDARLPGRAPQVFTVMGGLAAWGVAVLTAYPMVQVACAAGMPILVHLVRWVAFAIAFAATLTGFRVQAGAKDVDPNGPEGERAARVCFVGTGGLLLSAAGMLLLFIEDLATWVIDPCL